MICPNYLLHPSPAPHFRTFHCRLQFRTAKGTFVSSGESWGMEATFRTALDRMDRRLLRSKELAYNPRYAKDYLHKMGLPEQEL
jgi:hypothetical protein